MIKAKGYLYKSASSFMSLPDMFGKEIRLLFKGRQYYPSCCGITATIFTIFTVLLALISESLKFYRQDVITLNYFETRQATSIDLTPSNPIQPKELLIALLLHKSKFTINKHVFIEIKNVGAREVDCKAYP